MTTTTDRINAVDRVTVAHVRLTKRVRSEFQYLAEAKEAAICYAPRVTEQIIANIENRLSAALAAVDAAEADLSVILQAEEEAEQCPHDGLFATGAPYGCSVNCQRYQAWLN